MDTRYFETLKTVVETASFSRAATKLCITQSAVSQRIKSMEDQYGHLLLSRDWPDLTVTEAGRIVLEKAFLILKIEREIDKELGRLDCNRHLSICCTPAFGSIYLPGVLNKFLPEHSESVDMNFIIVTAEQGITGMVNGEYDLAVIEHCDEIDDSLLRTIALPMDELVFILPPGKEPDGELLTLQDLLGQRMLTRKDGCSSRRRLELNLKEVGLTLNSFKSIVIIDDLRLTIESVLAGCGIAFVSRGLVEKQLQEGILRAYHVKGFDHHRRRSILLNRNGSSTTLITDVIESLVRAF